VGPYTVRIAALAALGKMGKYREHRKDILEAITAVFKEPVDALSFRPYIAAIRALVERGHPDALPHLQRLADADPRPKVRLRARRAIKAIREGKDKGDELKKLREDLEKLQKENIKLRDRLARLEASLKPPTPKEKGKARRAKARKK